MPNPPKVPLTMDSYVRKTKPRVISEARPSHNVTAAPRASVRPAATVTAHLPPASPEDEVLPDLPRAARVRSGDRLSRAPGSASTGAAPSSPPPAPKPRKRFRKKVNGLFGDQTDLKKRMARLLLETNTRQLLSAENVPERQVQTRAQPRAHTESTNLPSAVAVVRKLQQSGISQRETEDSQATGVSRRDAHDDADEITHEDDNISLDSFESFDSPAFIATASRALGSPEKLRAVRKSMGRLSPRSNERFLEELQLGSSTNISKDETSRRKKAAKASDEISPPTPPDLPSVNSSEFETEELEAMREAILSMSPVSVERTGAPAVLRRKVRRLDRGYRSADVLRARLQGTPLSDFAASPTSHRRTERGLKWPRGRVRTLDLTQEPETVHLREGAIRKRSLGIKLAEASQPEDVESDDFSSDGSPPKKSRRLRPGPSAGKDKEDTTAGSAHAFAMLVEAAAVQQKQTSTDSVVRSKQLRSEGSSTDRRRRKRSRSEEE